MTLARRAITFCAFPSNMAAALLAAPLLLTAGLSAGEVIALITFSTAAVVALLERANPEYTGWNQSRGDIGTDIVHGIVSQGLVPVIMETVLRAGLLGAAAALATATAGFGGPWPASLPLGAQLALALVVTQFGEYQVHRAFHEVPLLWRLHAIHHSPHRLYFLNAGRFHPLDTATSATASLLPLVLLGVGDEVITLMTAWIAVHGLYQHCNIHLRLGPLNYVFSMAELHRWHHSVVLKEANANYGNNIIFWDLVFGTFYWPRDRDASETVGLSDWPGFPEDYLGQLAAPWSSGRSTP